MSQSLQQILATAVITLLRPLVRILLRNGVAYGSFAELAKKSFVEVAFDEFGVDGRKQTISRVSALTGLTRKEVKRLHTHEPLSGSDSESRYNRAVRVISAWVNDRRYQDSNGQPAELVVENSDVSFAGLVKDYSGDIPTQAMLSTLIEAGSVQRDGESVRLVRHAYIPGKDPADKIQILGNDVYELISTIDHNLTHNPPRLLFQRKVSNDCVNPGSVQELRRVSAGKAQELLEYLDALYTRHEVNQVPEIPESDDGKYISLGIYFYESGASREDEK